jgi:hypothetical protein
MSIDGSSFHGPATARSGLCALLTHVYVWRAPRARNPSPVPKLSCSREMSETLGRSPRLVLRSHIGVVL